MFRIAGSCVAVVVVAGCASTVTGEGHGTRSASSSPPPAPTTVTVTPTPTLAPDFAATFAEDHTGVVRIETVSCDASGVGSGFLLAPDLVVTVHHVVNGAVVVSLIDGPQRTTGTVIGVDAEHDLALVRAADPLSGHIFRFSPTAAEVGQEVAAIGFPIGDPITFTRGTVSGLDRRIVVDDTPRFGLLQTDAAINPGNSGGPLILADGRVVGLVDATRINATGIAYAVPAPTAAAASEQWRADPQTSSPPSCSDPLGPEQTDVTTPFPGGIDPDAAAGVQAAFDTYFNGINSGNYDAAFSVLSARIRAGTSAADFAEGVSTSYDVDQEVLSADQPATDTVHVGLAFVSLQAPDKGPDGEACTQWTLNYTMIRAGNGSWEIDGVAPIDGREHTPC